MKREILTKGMIRRAAMTLATAARRAAMMLLMMMLTAATAWAGDYTVTYSVVFGSNSITLKNGSNSAFIANSGNVWQGGTGVCVDDDYDITFKPSSNLNKTTDQITSATVFSMSSGNFTARVASNNSYYIKQVRLINVSIATATVTASSLNSKEITVSASGNILFDRIEVTLTDDFYGTITAYDDMTIGTAASLTDGGTNYYKSGTTITMNAPANYIVDEAKGVSNASIAADKRSYTFAMPRMNVSVGATTSEVHTISSPSGLTVTTNPYFTYNSTKYYKKGVTYTLTADADKAILSLTASGASGSSVASDKRTATVTMGSSNVTVTATFQTISGTCGTSATWSLAQDGSGNYTQLTISGTGEMTNYQNDGASIWHTTAPWGYGLTSVTIGNGVTKIGNYAFCGCQQLATATIGTSVTTLGEFAFNHCDAMTQITLPASVSSIGEQCFRNSTGLQRVDIQRTDGDLITLGSKVFNGCNALQYIVAPTPALAVQYKTATNWSDSKDKMGAEFGGFVFYATNEGGSAAYAITTADDLCNLAAAVNAGTDSSGKTFRQTAHIDFDNTKENNYTPIGCIFGSDYRCFSGNYDGLGHTIRGIRINKGGTDNSDKRQGVFGITDGADIRGITLADADITGYHSTGGIVGYNMGGTVSDCHVAADVYIRAVQSGVIYHGGIVGENQGTIEQCTSAATLTKNVNNSYYGGICGRNYNGALRHNLAVGVVVSAEFGYGAICGWNYGGTLEHNYYHACRVASNNVTATGKGCKGADVTANDGAVPTLRDNADNSTALGLLVALATAGPNDTPLDLGWGAGKYPMQLAGRTLYKDGAWNTLCLPFDVDGFSGTPLEGATVKELDITGTYSGHKTGLVGTTLYLYFKDATEIVAGKPYLVKWDVDTEGTEETEDTELKDPVFEGVTVSNAENDVTFTGGAFRGTYSPVTLEANDRSVLYLGAGNKLYWPSKDRTIGACRAYFQMSDGQEARQFVLNFDGDATGVRLIDNGELIIDNGAGANGQWSMVNGQWYDLSGRKISVPSDSSASSVLPKGVYIHGGKKVIIK